MDIEGIPSYLRPRYRVFLSVDIIGSTALKQAPVGKQQKHVFRAITKIADSASRLERATLGDASAAKTVTYGQSVVSHIVMI